MEHAIGTIVTLPDGRKAEVVEGRCTDCMFFDIISCYPYPDCSNPMSFKAGCECNKQYRSDRKNVIYKEVKND